MRLRLECFNVVVVGWMAWEKVRRVGGERERLQMVEVLMVKFDRWGSVGGEAKQGNINANLMKHSS